MKIRALLFDLGKVLIDFDFETGVQALHASCSISRHQLEDLLWDKRWIRRYERGEISQEKAAQVAGLDRTDFLLALAREGEDAFVVDFADLERELQRG